MGGREGGEGGRGGVYCSLSAKKLISDNGDSEKPQTEGELFAYFILP